MVSLELKKWQILWRILSAHTNISCISRNLICQKSLKIVENLLYFVGGKRKSGSNRPGNKRIAAKTSRTPYSADEELLTLYQNRCRAQQQVLHKLR